MPNGVYPIPKFHARPHHGMQPARLRLRLWWHRNELDEQLAAGAQPQAGTLLLHRAEQLCSRPERDRLARELEETLRKAHKPAPIRETGLPLRRREIRAVEEDILALVRRLQDAQPIDVQGAAMVVVLLADPSGPLSRAGATSLRFAVRSARLALDHPDEFALSLPEAA
jgi:hypothetical protein